MPELNTLLLFASASVLLALAPGPDNIFVLTQSILHGKSAGIATTLGLCTGLIVHTSLVALGLATVLRTSPIAFNLIKYLGASYLLFLAWKVFRAPSEKITLSDQGLDAPSRLYGRGIIMNLTNPKVGLFFLAFLPQFTEPSRGNVSLQIMLLGIIFILATILVFGGISLLAGFLSSRLSRSESAQRILNRIAGTVFAVLAVNLLLSGL